MDSIRRGLDLSSASTRNADSTRLGRNADIAGNPQKQTPEEEAMMANADFTNLYVLIKTATDLVENRAPKRKSGKKVNRNPSPAQSQNVVINGTWGDFQTYTTRSGQQYIGIKQGEQATRNDEESSEGPRQLQESPPRNLKVTTTASGKSQVSLPKKLKVKTIAAVQPQESPPETSNVKTTGAVHKSRPKHLKVQTTGANSMVEYERVAADSVENPENTGADLLEITRRACVPDPTKLGLHGIAVFNESTGSWTAYIWDGQRFYIDDSVKTPKHTGSRSENAPKYKGADLLEIRDGVCLPDPTMLSLHGISFYKRIGRWTSHIWDKKQFYIGSFASATEAAKAFDKVSLKHLNAAAAQPNYKGIYDYSEDVKEMAPLTNEKFRNLLNERSKLSKHVHVDEGVTRCPEGRFEVRIKLQKSWKFLGRFDNLEDAKRWYQMVSRWYQKQTEAGL